MIQNVCGLGRSILWLPQSLFYMIKKNILLPNFWTDWFYHNGVCNRPCRCPLESWMLIRTTFFFKLTTPTFSVHGLRTMIDFCTISFRLLSFKRSRDQNRLVLTFIDQQWQIVRLRRAEFQILNKYTSRVLCRHATSMAVHGFLSFWKYN